MNHGSQEEAKAELLGFLSRLLQEKFYFYLKYFYLHHFVIIF